VVDHVSDLAARLLQSALQRVQRVLVRKVEREVVELGLAAGVGDAGGSLE